MKISNILLVGAIIFLVYRVFRNKPEESGYWYEWSSIKKKKEKSQMYHASRGNIGKGKLSSGEDPCCNPPKCYRSGCMGAPCCDSATSMAPTKNYNSSRSNTSAYQAIPSPNYNLTDMPLRLAQITFGPESNYSTRAFRGEKMGKCVCDNGNLCMEGSTCPDCCTLYPDVQGRDKKKKKKKKKAKSRPMF